MKKYVVILSLLLLGGCASWLDNNLSSSQPLPEGVHLVESQQADPDNASIPYSKYRLDNGLTVILSPDDSDPLVHVDVTYHVGSAREQIGRSGFAHFFEHMMFQGSEHVGDQQHFKIVTEAGGELNGTTNRDRTNYFETVPSNQLEKMLWLEADRMGFLVNAVSQRKFEIQRDTVKNERAQNYDNRPYGLMYEKIGEALYPKNHPYSWQTIGYVEDLDRVDVNDLKAFFLRWYGPNNAVLTIGGDIDQAQTLAWVKKYFGSIPKGPEVTEAPKQPVTLTEDKWITLEDKIRQPLVMMAFPTTYRGEASQASIDALASVIGSGKNSLLYQRLVKTEKAIDAGAFHDCAELACTLYVYAMGDAEKNQDLTPIYQALWDALAEIKTKGIPQARLDAIIGSAEASAIYALQSVSGKVSQLASNETFYGQPDRLQTQLQAIRSVTPQSVLDAYNTFVDNKNKVVLSVVPKGKPQLAVTKATFTPPKRDLPQYKKITDEDLVLRQPQDDFDRAVIPPVGKAVAGKVPPLYKMTLENGIQVLGTENRETPTVNIQLSFPAGHRYVAKGKEGLANLTADMMNEATQYRSSEAIQEKLEQLGSSVSFTAGNYYSQLSVTSLTKNLSQTLDIAQEMLFHPAFNEADFLRLKNQSIQGLIYSHQKPSWLASQGTKKVLYGDSLFNRDSDGTLASIEQLTLQDVKDFYQDHYIADGAHLVIVGDIKENAVKQTLSFINQWPAKGQIPSWESAGEVADHQQQTIFFIEQANAPQSIIYLARLGMPYDPVGEMYLTQLANYNLAGNFNSRINQNLREDKGYTYGASGGVVGSKETGQILFTAQVRADATAPAIQEFIREMRNYSQKGMTEEEVAFMRQAVGQKEALKYETPSQKAGLLSSILVYNLPDDYREQRANLLETVNQQQLNALAKKWFDPKAYQIIVVGDKAHIPALKDLGFKVQALTIEK